MSNMLVKKCIWFSFAKATFKSNTGTVYSINCLDRICPLIMKRNSFHSNIQMNSEKRYKVTFIKWDGDRITAKGKEGDSLLDVINDNNLDLPGFGACNGAMGCGTCHCIFKREHYDKLPVPSIPEEDLLDEFEITDTSRLGCQIKLSPDLDDLEVQVPEFSKSVRR